MPKMITVKCNCRNDTFYVTANQERGIDLLCAKCKESLLEYTPNRLGVIFVDGLIRRASKFLSGFNRR